jgi:lysozyme
VNLQQMLVRDEGVILHCYEDHLGFKTIGVGRLVDKRKGGGITLDEAMYLLQNDIKKVTSEVLQALPWVNTMNEARRAVVFAMCFQMGLKGLLGFRASLDAMRDEKYEHAAEGMRRSLWAKQTPERAKRMAHQMATGDFQ